MRERWNGRAYLSRRAWNRGMKSVSSFALALCAFAPAAFGFELKPCEDVGVGLTSLVTPLAKHHLLLYDGKVVVYNVDTIEPACCSGGVAVVMPDKDDPLGGSSCSAVVGIGSVDVTKAKRTYDPARGLLLDAQTQRYDGESGLKPGPQLKIRIDLNASRVSIEP